MTDLMQAVAASAKGNAEVDNQIQQILIEQFGINNMEDKDTQTAGYKAYALEAVQVGVAIANMVMALRNPASHRTYQAFCDLTYNLNTNTFWNKNASVILPILHVWLNTYRDGATFIEERIRRNEYSSHDALIAGSRVAPLEVFPVLAYLVGGPPLMLRASAALKVQLAPFLVE